MQLNLAISSKMSDLNMQLSYDTFLINLPLRHVNHPLANRSRITTNITPVLPRNRHHTLRQAETTDLDPLDCYLWVSADSALQATRCVTKLRPNLASIFKWLIDKPQDHRYEISDTYGRMKALLIRAHHRKWTGQETSPPPIPDTRHPAEHFH